MNEEIPLKLLHVQDFHISISFYRDKIGFPLQRIDPEMETALFHANGVDFIVTTHATLDREAYRQGEHDPFTSANLEEEEAPEYPTGRMEEEENFPERMEPEEGGASFSELLQELPDEPSVKEEERLEFPGENLLFHQERLANLGIVDMLLEEYPGIEQLLILKDPEGHEIVFRESLRLNEEELFSLYGKGADLLEGAILGLTEEQLAWSLPESESIRHLILKICDFEMEMTQRIKWALADSGRSYPLPLYDADEWADALDYETRPVHVEMTLFRLLRDQIMSLCDRLPEALSRYLVSEHGTVEVQTMMQVVAESVREYVQQILEICRFHEKTSL